MKKNPNLRGVGLKIHFRKIFLVMKLTFFLVCCLVFTTNASVNAQLQTVSLKLENVSVSEAIRQLKKQTRLDFFFSNKEVNVNQKITLNVRRAKLDEVLTQIFGTDFRFEYMDDMVIIGPASASYTTLPQQKGIVVEGRVTDSHKQPLPGVTVMIKGTTLGTVTNAEGDFSFTIPSMKDIIVSFSFIGMKTAEVKYTGQKEIQVVLTEEVAEMEEVVITGFQRREKAVMVGSVSTATARDLETSGVTTVDKALAGKLAGVYIRSASGRPGETGKIQIRGINTMTGNTEPLYVLDGMPLQTGEVSGGINNLLTNGIGNIPPENIKSISILKDATAASIYGSRAANGVVVIETKMGEAGADYISYSGKFGVTMAPKNQFDFMNTTQKIQLERELYEQFHPTYGGRVIQLLNLRDKGTLSGEEVEQQIAALGKVNTDWMDVLYDNAFSQSHNLTLSGGNTKTQYFASLNYEKADGTMKENSFQTGGLNMKLSRYVTDKLLVKFSLYTTLKKNQEGQAGRDVFQYAAFANPYERPYQEDGSYAADMSYRDLSNDIGSDSDLNYKDFNILKELRNNTLTNNYFDARAQFGVEWSFFDHFRYQGTGVLNYTWVHDIDEARPGTYRSWGNNWLNNASSARKVLPEYNQGFLKENTGRVFDYTVRNSLEYNNRLADIHFLQLFFAAEFGARTNYKYNSFNPLYLADYRIAGYPSWNVISADNFYMLDLERFGSSYFDEDRSASFIGSLVYSYADRYVLNANVRYDGVDILGSDNQFSPLWSAGVKWNAHSESFLKNYNGILSRLVVSLGYGYRGSINRSVYPFHSYLLGSGIYNGIVNAYEFRFGNPTIKWEKKREINLGLELSLWEGRFNIEGRYFDEKITDLLDNVKLSPSVGRQEATLNVGRMSNRGIELSTRVEVVKSDNILWEVGGNITKVKNKLDEVYEKELPAIAQSSTRNIQSYPTNGWFGYKYSHVNPQDGHMMVKALRRNAEIVPSGVSVSYKEEVIDLSAITQKDLQDRYVPYYLGQQDPKFYGGFNTRLVFRQFELYANFVFAGGNKIIGFQDRLNGPDGVSDDISASRTNRLVKNAYRWKQYGDITDIPGFSNSISNYTRYLIDRDLEKGGYLKCNELALTWRAPRAWLKKSALSTLKATLVAGNLFTVTSYNGTDPETQTPFGYPNTRSYTFTLNVGF